LTHAETLHSKIAKNTLARLITYLVPPSIPSSHSTLRSARLADSLAGLIAANPSFTVPFVTWLLMGYFGSIPEELEEAALGPSTDTSKVRLTGARKLPSVRLSEPRLPRGRAVVSRERKPNWQGR